jgi:hypothetical protein
MYGRAAKLILQANSHDLRYVTPHFFSSAVRLDRSFVSSFSAISSVSFDGWIQIPDSTMATRMVSLEMEPYTASIDLNKTALIMIDMQIDFLEVCDGCCRRVNYYLFDRPDPDNECLLLCH